MRHRSHVWLDSVWMPTLSYATAKRAFHEWLDVMPSNRIMWGADANHGEGIYGATEMTRRCLAEVLAERVDRGDLREEHALRSAARSCATTPWHSFPQLKDRLWKHKGITMKPPAPGVDSSACALSFHDSISTGKGASRGKSAASRTWLDRRLARLSRWCQSYWRIRTFSFRASDLNSSAHFGLDPRDWGWFVGPDARPAPGLWISCRRDGGFARR